MAVVQCPNCGEQVVWSAASPYRPFCSVRCKNVDLGAWASERYAITGEPEGSADPASDDPDSR